MASLLKSYEQQFGVITASITSKTATLNPTSGEDKKLTAQQIIKELDEAKDILEQMELEVRELEAGSRNKYLTRIESYQAELARLEKDFNTKKSTCDGGREELLGDQGVEDFYDQKQLLINNSEKLERGIKRLDLGYQVAVETEQIGNNILTDLNQQRETIQKTRNRLRETDEELGRSGRMLNRMLARIVQNRLIFLGIILALVIVVILVLYIRFRKSS